MLPNGFFDLLYSLKQMALLCERKQQQQGEMFLVKNNQALGMPGGVYFKVYSLLFYIAMY